MSTLTPVRKSARKKDIRTLIKEGPIGLALALSRLDSAKFLMAKYSYRYAKDIDNLMKAIKDDFYRESVELEKPKKKMENAE